MTRQMIPSSAVALPWLAEGKVVRRSVKSSGIYRILFDDAHVLSAFSGREYPCKRYPEFLVDLGLSSDALVCLKQEHTSDIFVVEDSKSQNQIRVGDGIVTAQCGIAIGVRTADCVPVFCFDPVKRVIAIVHAGWKGALKGVVGNAVGIMSDRFGCHSANVRAVLGPCIRFCCYEVGEEFQRYFPDFYKRLSHQPSDSKAHVDLPAVVTDELRKAGVLAHHISDVAVCTSCQHDHFFSARRGDGDDRILSVMALLPV